MKASSSIINVKYLSFTCLSWFEYYSLIRKVRRRYGHIGFPAGKQTLNFSSGLQNIKTLIAAWSGSWVQTCLQPYVPRHPPQPSLLHVDHALEHINPLLRMLRIPNRLSQFLHLSSYSLAHSFHCHKLGRLLMLSESKLENLRAQIKVNPGRDGSNMTEFNTYMITHCVHYSRRIHHCVMHLWLFMSRT